MAAMYGRNVSVSLQGNLYHFDKVSQPDATQQDVFDGTAAEIVTDVLARINGTIFAFGQKASGKIHTMKGVLIDDSATCLKPRTADAKCSNCGGKTPGEVPWMLQSPEEDEANRSSKTFSSCTKTSSRHPKARSGYPETCSCTSNSRLQQIRPNGEVDWLC